MKLLTYFVGLSILAMTSARADEIRTPDVCRVQCECWGQFGGDYDQRPPFLIGIADSSGWCPTNMDKQQLYKIHVDKIKIKCQSLGQNSSASKFLGACKKNF